jgi:predicted DNA-binding transcriptional regulator
MNEAIKAYMFIPSGFRNYLEEGFDGWRFVFFLYIIFSAILAYVSGDSPKEIAFIFLQPIFLLIVFSIFSTLNAFIVGADEPIVKGLRMVALCLPPIGLSIYLFAEKSHLSIFVVYPALLFIIGSIFLSRANRILNLIPAIFALALTGGLTYLHATTIDKWFGHELTLANYQVSIIRSSDFTENETRVYRFLLESPARLGYIPQIDEIADSLGIDRMNVRSSLLMLDHKGRIVMVGDNEIRYAYPWASFNNGYDITIKRSENSPSVRAYAASAMHALSIPLIVKEGSIGILSHLRDTGQLIEISIIDGKIDTANFPEAQVYRSDTFSEMDFYSSPAGAKASYRGRFDSSRLLNLDRAIIVAEEMLRKRTAGIL